MVLHMLYLACFWPGSKKVGEGDGGKWNYQGASEFSFLLALLGKWKNFPMSSPSEHLEISLITLPTGTQHSSWLAAPSIKYLIYFTAGKASFMHCTFIIVQYIVW